MIDHKMFANTAAFVPMLLSPIYQLLRGVTDVRSITCIFSTDKTVHHVGAMYALLTYSCTKLRRQFIRFVVGNYYNTTLLSQGLNMGRDNGVEFLPVSFKF